MDSYLTDSARVTATPRQLILVLFLAATLLMSLTIMQDTSLFFLYLSCGLWLFVASWKLFCLHNATPPNPRQFEPDIWPRYTVVAALYDEAAILPQLIERLSRLDYPHDRLQGFLALEAKDAATIEAAQSLPRPSWLQVLIVPPGSPQTKPRALNYALERATGDIITVYDAEDDPDPLQLKEAAIRFITEPGDLVCLQAPLRIRRKDKSRSKSPFLDAQFAIEYAALFEVSLPALTRLGLPFPLGGTSNHFRVNRLRQIGGWDAWNVTEDADLGFRIWRTGGRLGVISRPTYETPPGDLRLWLPQRTRWLKGYMQTLLVHTRQRGGMGFRGWLSLTMTLIVPLMSAAIHAMTIAWVGALCLTAAVSTQLPSIPPLAIATFGLGAIANILVAIEGARRAQVRLTLWDIVTAPAYWSLLTLAFAHAATRLILEPHRWDKTPHKPELMSQDPVEVFADAGRQAA